MRNVGIIMRRELASYFATPLAYVFIVISTHILEEVDAVCTRAIIISRGRIVADDTPAELEARGRLEDVFREVTTGARLAPEPAEVAR